MIGVRRFAQFYPMTSDYSKCKVCHFTNQIIFHIYLQHAANSSIAYLQELMGINEYSMLFFVCW